MDYLKYIDCFGIKFHFYTNNQPNHQNIFGGIMTFIYVLICIVLFIAFSYDDIYRLNPISSISEISDIKPKKINIKNEKIWIPFRIITDENKYIDHRGILHIFPYLVEGIFNNHTGMQLQYHLLNYKLCNETSMENKPDNYHIDIPLNELFCIEQEDIQFGGNWNGNFINFIEIKLFLCEEGIYYNSSDPRCSNINKISNNLNSSLLFDFYYPIVQFQPRNSKNPISVTYGKYFYRLSAFTHKLEKLYLQEHIFSDDRNIITTNYKNISFWGTYFFYGDDYFITVENDPLTKNKLSEVFTLEIYMNYGLILYSRTYEKIFHIISNVFPLFRLILYLFKKITQHIKKSLTKRELAELIFEKRNLSKISLKNLGDMNQNINQYKTKIKKEDESNDGLILKEKNNSPIENNLLNNIKFNISSKKIDIKKDFNEIKIEDKISHKNKDQSKLSLNDENGLKKLSNKIILNINLKRKSFTINDNIKRYESPNTKSKKNRKRRNNHIFSFYYFFFDFIFDKLVNPQSFFCVPKAYFIVYNFMCQIYDISTHIILFKQFNLLNNTLKKIYEENGFCPAHPFKKININDNDIIDKLNKELKSKKYILFSKNL